MRPVRALIGLADKYTTKRLEAACRHAMHFATSSHRSVKNNLVHELDCHSSNPHSRRTDRSSSGSHASTATSTPTTPHRLPRSRDTSMAAGASRRQDRHRGQELSHGQLRALLTGTAAALGGLRPNRRGAQGCPDTTSPGGGALQAVLARSFSRHRAEVCPEAPTPGHIGILGPPSLSRVAQVGCPPPSPAGCRVGHACGPAVVGSRAVSGSNQMAPNTRTRRSGLIQRSPRFAT